MNLNPGSRCDPGFLLRLCDLLVATRNPRAVILFGSLGWYATGSGLNGSIRHFQGCLPGVVCVNRIVGWGLKRESLANYWLARE
jgi:hypothetical protein